MEFTNDYTVPCIISTLTHPLTYARTMMLLGYEPDPPYIGLSLRSIIKPGYKVYYYPSVFKYLHSLRENIGLFNLFTVGLPASIIGSFVKSYCTDYAMEHLDPHLFAKKTFYVTNKGLKKFILSTTDLTLSRLCGIILSYPFQVVMIRQMAQFVNETDTYGYLLIAFPSIVKNEGILSLFSGLVPRLIGEVITVWLTACFAYVMNEFIFAHNFDPSFKKHTPFVAGIMVSHATHSLTVTSTVMASVDSRINISPHFNYWWECYSYLAKTDSFVRGSSLLFRRVPGQVQTAISQ